MSIIQPDKCIVGYDNRNSPIALQEQKEIFLLPTVRVSNFLHSEIHVLLTETGESKKCSEIIISLYLRLTLAFCRSIHLSGL